VKDEKPINLKLISHDIKEYYCIRCLAQKLGCDEKDIRNYIEYLRESGKCVLFR